jgi:hypothetical protein
MMERMGSGGTEEVDALLALLNPPLANEVGLTSPPPPLSIRGGGASVTSLKFSS